ncbi:MAG: alcohol dehydrogenase catalytic domain-containing protein [Gammaproteobacteria bacterium]|nr:alcohol dehydrogenase catalytic domain-containing protein [Gammaproteobacteria bacterium]
MKAAIFQGVNKPLTVEDIPAPEPAGSHDVVVRVGRCGICGTDLHITEDPIFGVPAGVVLGHEYSGEVVATGAEVKTVKTGDLVAVNPLMTCGECKACLAGDLALCASLIIGGGGYGQYSLVREHQCVKMPDGVSIEDGALVEPLAVGLRAVTLAQMQQDARVLVVGAGPIGLAVAFWARRMGAGKIAVTASSNRREALAMEMGASVFVTPGENPVVEVNQALGSAPDIVFECVGKTGLIQRCIEYVAPRGTVVVAGICTHPDTINPFMFVTKECRLQPSIFYNTSDFHTTLDVLESGDTCAHSMITDTVSIDETPLAFEALKQRTTQCKVLIDSWNS